MKISYRFRCYPTEGQQAFLAKQFGVCRYAYNWALRQRIDAYKDGKRMNYAQSSRAWTVHRNELPWALEVSSVPAQQALRHLQFAFASFFAKRSGFPVFKRKKSLQTATYVGRNFTYSMKNQVLSLAKVGQLKVNWSREFISEPTTVTIIKSPSGRYHVVLTLDELEPQQLTKTGKSVGIDLGIARLATLSNGEKIPNPKHLSANLAKLKRENKSLHRKKQGSGRWESQRIKVARLHEHIAASRKDSLDKLTTDLVRKYDQIMVEDLDVRGMLGKKRSLSRNLSDASLGTVLRMLEYKCDWYGKELVKIDRFYPSSKTCSSCGYVLEKLPLNQRVWTCPECSIEHDRDLNAAKNILAVGYTVSARGGGVRPKRATAR